MISLRSLAALKPALALPRLFAPSLLHCARFDFAFMQLFERNKRPDELDPIFKRATKLKGHLKSKATKQFSKKLNTNVRRQKQKLKNHKGLLKRIKIVVLS